MNKNNRIFIVEDDLISAQYLREILEQEGFDVIGSSDTAEGAIEKLRECNVDLVLMDIVLKGAMTGSEAALQLRKMHPECKILFLTAYADDEMIDYAIDANAFAYLMKPYREREIIATIKTALAQPAKKNPSDEKIVLKNGFVFDRVKKRLEKDGYELPLTPTKLKLIELLALNKNSIVSNEQLAMHIWNEPKDNSTLRSLITRFRITIGDDIITNVNGMGYTISA
ncbi:response regulator [Hydrogenimonas sp.]|uniref:response regulator n=1 Tax=Hydrogenimonas sp. TaxID=2231112 RepID=UPI002612ABB9|nr:response regulator [Hydrogenimonas sp.]